MNKKQKPIIMVEEGSVKINFINLVKFNEDCIIFTADSETKRPRASGTSIVGDKNRKLGFYFVCDEIDCDSPFTIITIKNIDAWVKNLKKDYHIKYFVECGKHSITFGAFKINCKIAITDWVNKKFLKEGGFGL